MMRIACLVASNLLLSVCACSQEPQPTRADLVAAIERAKITLVDAVNKANAVQRGTVVQAALRAPGKEHAQVAYEVQVLSEGRLFAVAVDAVNGAVGAAVELKAERDPKGIKLDFEGAADGALPTGWRAAETAGSGRPGSWRVEETRGAPSGKHVLRLVESKNIGETFNLVMSEAVFPVDLDLAVKIHADAGEEDRGGGLLWRATDANNYYLVRWNPLEENLRAYKVVGGNRSMFQSVDVKADAAQWHAIGIHTKVKTFEVSFDGKTLITCEDGTFARPGRVGVWTKADAASSFDDLEVHSRQ
jgi:hypothetical protein